MSGASGVRAAAVGPAVALLGVAPLFVARFLWHTAAAGGVDGVGLDGSCPLLEHVGVPCAGCGASRALFHFAHGDTSFLDYNWFWIVAGVVALYYGVVVIARGLAGRPAPLASFTRQPRVLVTGAVIVAAAAWLVALTNIGAIRG